MRLRTLFLTQILEASLPLRPAQAPRGEDSLRCGVAGGFLPEAGFPRRIGSSGRDSQTSTNSCDSSPVARQTLNFQRQHGGRRLTLGVPGRLARDVPRRGLQACRSSQTADRPAPHHVRGDVGLCWLHSVTLGLPLTAPAEQTAQRPAGWAGASSVQTALGPRCGQAVSRAD